MRLFPRMGTYSCSTPGLDDHDERARAFDGRVLIIQWLHFVIEIAIGSRK